MNAQHPRNGSVPPQAQLSEEAAEWFLRMLSPDADPEDIYGNNTAARNEAFREWYSRSPEHLRAFLDICEVDHLMMKVDAQHRGELDAIVANRKANVIPLYAAQSTRPPRRIRKAWVAAAAASLAAVGLLVPTFRSGTHDFATSVGEQRTAKLDDGSIVYLNTDTQIEVNYTKGERDIRLLKGEALFVVEHDPKRPFIVTAENARVRAVGTQFNVRDRTSSVDVSVVEGVVQVTTSDTDANPAADGVSAIQSPVGKREAAATPTRVSAGEVPHITSGRVVAAVSPAVADTVSWRQRRLVFKNATLGEVATEFNRYNRVQIRVEGDIAQVPMFKAAVFDADRPQALILYASKDEALSVEADGENWVIRAR